MEILEKKFKNITEKDSQKSMNKYSYFFLKNKHVVYSSVMLLMHAILAALFWNNGLQIIFAYNLISFFIFISFLLLAQSITFQFCVTFGLWDMLIYSAVATFLAGADFGTTVLTIFVSPVFFLSALQDKSSRKNYFLMSLLAGIVSLIIVFRNYGRQDTMINGYLTTVTIYKDLYKTSSVCSILFTTAIVFYLMYLTEFSILRSQRKNFFHKNELEFIANHDQLTNLMNRRAINQYLTTCEENKKANGKDYAISIFDIDGFKKINDTYGHDAGDFILQRLAKIVTDSLIEGERLARWGGEEFVILFENYSENVVNRLETIRKRIQECSHHWKGLEINITVTFGLASSKSGMTTSHITTKADEMLMWGKQHGKNQVCRAEDF